MHELPPPEPNTTNALEDEGFILLTELRPIVPLQPQHIRNLVRHGKFPASGILADAMAAAVARHSVAGRSGTGCASKA